MLGKSANGGFVGFFISLVLFACYVVIWCLAHIKRTGAVIALFVPFAVVVGITIFGWPGTVNIIRCMHVVKTEVPAGKSGKEKNKRPSPIVISRQEIKTKLRQFAKQLEDQRLVGPESFKSYLRELDQQENGNMGKRDLSWMSLKAVEKELEILFEELYEYGRD
mmetsp:Transcript_39450/g.61506  ORF Transcript_39450/g.61506 Transcript_39450/m.61506 type:complete len:164 (+) Transcript_39450:1181-1672(+)